MVKQKTIKAEISLTGVGLHTGKEVKITFKNNLNNMEILFQNTNFRAEPQ